MRKKIGDILIESDLITSKQLSHALSVQQTKKQRLGKILVGLGYVTQDQIAEALSGKLDLPIISCADLEISDELKKLIPKKTAEKHLVFPVQKKGNTIILAMADPLDYRVIDDIFFSTRLKVSTVISYEWSIRKAIEKNYSENEHLLDVFGSNITADKEIEFKEEKDEDVNIEALYTNSKSPPIIKLVAMIVSEAVKERASDIHIEPREHYSQIRFRVDGEMRNIFRYNKKIHESVVSRIKIISRLDITKRRIPQDGSTHVSFQGKEIDLRVSTAPAIYGEKIVIRLLNQSSGSIPLDELGISEHIRTSLHEIFKRPQGMFIVTGPTGSGKTTTLYACLNQVRSETRNIITIEDPVEYKLDGITQISVDEASGRTFSSVLRSVLRQDPDVIMIGEIRDMETANIAIKAALTGHFVISTIHTNNTVATITRFIDIGIPPYLVSSALSGILAQRLVRKICSHCKVESEASEEQIAFAKIYGLPKIKNQCYGNGCQRCHNTGYSGRIAVYEYLSMVPSIKRLVSKDINENALLSSAKKTGVTFLIEDAWDKVNTGITTFSEVIAKIPMDYSLNN